MVTKPNKYSGAFICFLVCGIVLMWIARDEQGFLQAALLSIGSNLLVVSLLFLVFEALFHQQPGGQEHNDVEKWRGALREELEKRVIVEKEYDREKDRRDNRRRFNNSSRRQRTHKDIAQYSDDDREYQ